MQVKFDFENIHDEVEFYQFYNELEVFCHGCIGQRFSSKEESQMKKTRVLAIVLVLMTIFATPAYALPNRWKGTPKFTRAGITYRVKGHDAVVARTRGKRVTIPAKVTYKGKVYRVRCIWPDALKGAKVVTIHGSLRDGCESARLWKVKVRVTNRDVYKWLHQTGADVTLV